MNDFFNLKGRVAIVTGGGSGLGVGIGSALGVLGANVVLCDIKENLLEKAVADLKSEGIPVISTICDVTRPETFRATLDAAQKAFGTADILINNAGVTKSQDALDVTLADWDYILNINVKGLFECTQLFAKELIAAQKEGHVVNVASNGAKVTYSDQVHYCASKAAVVNMTQCLADSFAKHNINVNAVCPGAVDTDMLKGCMIATEQATGGKVTVEDCIRTWGPPQLGRLIQPVEVGRIIAFLCTPAAQMIRGQSINVDAGNTRF